MSDSDIIPFSEQPLLPGIEHDSALGAELLESEESQRARYSGRTVEKNQERVRGILAARAMNFPIRQICAAYQVSAHTIAAIEDRHRVKLATLKQSLARKFGMFLELGVDRAIAEVDKMDRDKLMVSLGIAADKLQVLTGEASVIVGSPSGEGSRFSVDGLRARLQARPIIDVTPTGLDGRETNQTRASAAAASTSAPAADSETGSGQPST